MDFSSKRRKAISENHGFNIIAFISAAKVDVVGIMTKEWMNECDALNDVDIYTVFISCSRMAL